MQPASTASVTTTQDAVVQLAMVMRCRLRSRPEGGAVDPSQAAILSALEADGPMRLGDLAETLRLDASTVSRHVQQLGERGHVDRVPDPEDGRACIVAANDSGRAALQHTLDRPRAVIGEVIADWTDADRESLRDGVLRLVRALDDV